MGSNQPGGGCEIIYNESKFIVESCPIVVPKGVEGIWRLAKPKFISDKIKVIAIGSFYISPKSKYKQETIDHIIESVHFLRSQHDNSISFLVGGDFNKTPVNEILLSYGAL